MPVWPPYSLPPIHEVSKKKKKFLLKQWPEPIPTASLISRSASNSFETLITISIFPKSPSKSMFGTWEQNVQMHGNEINGILFILGASLEGGYKICSRSSSLSQSFQHRNIQIIFNVTPHPWSNYSVLSPLLHYLSKMTLKPIWSIIVQIPTHYPKSDALPSSIEVPLECSRSTNQAEPRWSSDKQKGL